MIDLRTEQILKNFRLQIKLKKFITIICYLVIFGGIIAYITLSLTYKKDFDQIAKIKENRHNIDFQKVIVNPRINYQYNEDQIYRIEATRAEHTNKEDAILYDVFAEGELGKITAGQLDITENGEILTFTKNPVLILNNTDNNQKF